MHDHCVKLVLNSTETSWTVVFPTPGSKHIAVIKR